jgi:large subunit ribosomal protein L35
MPKIKTHKSAAKRFALTGTGKIKRAKAYKNHKLNQKSRKTKRNLRHGDLVCAAEEKNVKKMIPYK